MWSYSTDHNGLYPDGKSSTEVFQKLIDEGYVADPEILYIPLPGKIEAQPGQKLKPENVCFDVTSGIDSSASDLLPVVFMTGYRINYVSGGTAEPVIKPYPQFMVRTWTGWWKDEPPMLSPGLAVYYKGNNAMFLRFPYPDTPGTSIINFVPPDFKPDGKTYRQLTPDGSLPAN